MASVTQTHIQLIDMIFQDVLVDNMYVFRKAAIQSSSECLSTLVHNNAIIISCSFLMKFNCIIYSNYLCVFD